MKRATPWMIVAAMVGALLCAAAPEAQAIGLLIPTETSVTPLAVKSHRVTVNVTDQTAVTRVEQVFTNHTNRQLEATFYFPVPKGATVSDFSLWINGKKTKGAVLEREKARAIYEGIVRRTEDPGLIEYMDGTLFQARIFPVPARGDQKVEIAFASVMDQTEGMRRLVYPLKTGRSAAHLLQDMTVVVNISSRAPLKAIYSPTHRVQVKRRSDFEATVSAEEIGADLERDFLLYMDTGDEDIGLSVLTYDPDGKGGEDGYYLMVLSPKLEVDEEDVPSKTVTFVVDTSGSMAGEKMEQARAALTYCLNRLREKDRFNVVRFSTDVEALFRSPQPATKDRIKQGLEFARVLEAAGGTAIDDALQEALQQPVGRDAPHFVLFMTDGLPTVGTTNIQTIINNTSGSNRQGARLFTFGVGYNVNTVLLDQIAGDHGGTSDYVREGEDIEIKVTGLYNRIAFPMMTDLAVDYGSTRTYDVYPKRLPDLFRGGQVVAVGRTRNAFGSTLRVSGRVGDEAITLAFEDEVEEEEGDDAPTVAHDFIPKIWATRKVGYLLQEIRASGEQPELKKEVIRLARRYGLVTPYTSYLAVDDSEFDRRPTPPPVTRRPPMGPMGGGAPVLEEAAEDDGDGWGGGGRRTASAPSRPQRDALRKQAEERKKREEVLAKPTARSAAAGKDGVDASMATKALKQANSAQDAASRGSRYVDGQLFVLKSGVWRQDGLEVSGGVVKIKYLSKAWFNLLEARPELRKKLSLGGAVVLRVGGRVVEVGPAGREDVAPSEFRSW